MGFAKIKEEELVGKGVVGLPDRPSLSTLDMQKKFDELARDVIIPKFNKLSGEIDKKFGVLFIGDYTTETEVDFNNLTEDGNYDFNASYITNAVNAPISTETGTLTVKHGETTGYITQIYQSRNGNVFVRFYNNATWMTWERLAKSSDIVYSKILDNISVANVVENGRYRIFNAKDTPNNVAKGYLEVTNYGTGTGYRKIVWTELFTNVSYQNILNNGVWSGWEQIATKSDLNNALSTSTFFCNVTFKDTMKNMADNTFMYAWSWDKLTDSPEDDHGGYHTYHLIKYEGGYNRIINYSPYGVFVGRYDYESDTLSWDRQVDENQLFKNRFINGTNYWDNINSNYATVDNIMVTGGGMTASYFVGLPSDSDGWGDLYCFQANSDRFMQIFYGWNSNKYWIRSRVSTDSGNFWTAWKQLLTSDNITYSNGVLTIG